LTSSFSWGGQVYETKTRRLNAFAEDFGLPGAKKDIDAAALTEAFEGIVDLTSGGFFLQEMIGWNDQLFVTAGVRWDGFSTFGEDFGLAAYPKVSAAYLISDNDFWPTWWDELKLRGAVGWSGRAPGTFDATRTWDAISGDDGQLGVTPSNPGDPNLGPEKTREFELGAEGTMFGGRASFEYSYYNQKTFDALVGVQQVPSQGFVSQQLQNIGTITSTGRSASDTPTTPAWRRTSAARSCPFAERRPSRSERDSRHREYSVPCSRTPTPSGSAPSTGATFRWIEPSSTAIRTPADTWAPTSRCGSSRVRQRSGRLRIPGPQLPGVELRAQHASHHRPPAQHRRVG
jgi:hypothetical protein